MLCRILCALLFVAWTAEWPLATDRVLYNGLSVQNNVECDGPTRAGMNHPEASTNPIMLQGDHGPVAYRNVRIRPVDLP